MSRLFSTLLFLSPTNLIAHSPDISHLTCIPLCSHPRFTLVLDFSVKGTGIFEVSPQQCPDAVFDHTIILGYTTLSALDVIRVIEHLEPLWPGRDYDMAGHNCNEFSQVFSHHLLHPEDFEETDDEDDDEDEGEEAPVLHTATGSSATMSGSLQPHPDDPNPVVVGSMIQGTSMSRGKSKKKRKRLLPKRRRRLVPRYTNRLGRCANNIRCCLPAKLLDPEWYLSWMTEPPAPEKEPLLPPTPMTPPTPSTPVAGLGVLADLDDDDDGEGTADSMPMSLRAALSVDPRSPALPMSPRGANDYVPPPVPTTTTTLEE